MDGTPVIGDVYDWQGLRCEVIAVQARTVTILVTPVVGPSWTKRQPLPLAEGFVKT